MAKHIITLTFLLYILSVFGSDLIPFIADELGQIEKT